MKFLWFAIGFLAGAVAGYLAGILSAPTTGEETRHEISGRAIELRERAQETATRVRENVLGAPGASPEGEPESLMESPAEGSVE